VTKCYTDRRLCICSVACSGFANSKKQKSVRVDDDYSYYNDYEVKKATRRRGRGRQQTGWRPRHRGHAWRTASTADAIHARTRNVRLLLTVLSVLLLLIVSTDCTVQTTQWQLHFCLFYSYTICSSEKIVCPERRPGLATVPMAQAPTPPSKNKKHYHNKYYYGLNIWYI